MACYILWKFVEKGFTFFMAYCIINTIITESKIMMKQRLIKSVKKVVLFKPNNRRLSFYMFSITDKNENSELSINDLKGITLLDDDFELNADLFDVENCEDVGNIYSLMDEGVLKDQPTGADLGIYNYNTGNAVDYSKYIGNDFKIPIEECDRGNIVFPKFLDDEITDCDFGDCILAQDDDVLWQGSTPIRTFKGYLEVSLDDKSIVRLVDTTGFNGKVVYIPRLYISKYLLRNGDEIVGVFNKVDGDMVATTLFTINQIPCSKWTGIRPWFKQLGHSAVKQNVNIKSLYSIANRFGIFKGDNVFLYLKQDTAKSAVLPQLISDFSLSFDQIIYINPNYKSTFLGEAQNIVKFCVGFNASHKFKISAVLLGANYARRMIEMGKNVAILIDDVDGVAELDISNVEEMPVGKTIWNTSISASVGGGTIFTIVSDKGGIDRCELVPRVVKNVETLGVFVEGGQASPRNSYRV